MKLLDKHIALAKSAVPIRKLLSPGPVQSEYSTDLRFSHRSDEFRQLYAETRNQLVKLTNYQNLVMCQSSATSAVETVLSSVLKTDSRILILVNGEFGRRAARMASFCSQSVVQVDDMPSLINRLENDVFDFCFVVMFETSLSIYNDTNEIEKICKRKNIHLIVDAVSAFPYYPSPSAKFMITTSSKQLRGLPAMGLIFYNDLEDIELLERSECLNLKKYIDYADRDQTPHTSLIPQIDSLNKALTNLDVEQLRVNIARNAQRLIAGLEDIVVNEKICPVVTFRANDPAKLIAACRAEGISLYQNLFYMKNSVQVGCFNYDTVDTYALVNELFHQFKPW